MELLDLIRREGGAGLTYRRELIRFFGDNAADLAEFDLNGTLAALFKCRYRDQPTRFEWGYDPDALKQQDRWQKFSTRELKSLKQALAIADGESMLDDTLRGPQWSCPRQTSIRTQAECFVTNTMIEFVSVRLKTSGFL